MNDVNGHTRAVSEGGNLLGALVPPHCSGGGTNDGADDPDANKDGGDSDRNSGAMLVDGTEVSRRDVDSASKQGNVRWMPLHCLIVDLTKTLLHLIIFF